MKEEQNIDKIIREKLEGYTEEPPAFIWPGIMDQLKAAQLKKRRAWYSWSAVAALLLIAFIAGWYLNETTSPAGITVTEVATQEKGKVSGENEAAGQLQPEKRIEGGDKKEQFFADVAEMKKEVSQPSETRKQVKTNEFLASKRVDLTFMKRLEPADAVVLYSGHADSSEPEIQQENTIDFHSFEQEIITGNARLHAKISTPQERWKLGMSISPGYSSYTARHSAGYASNMTYEASAGNSNLSGGISVRYKTGKRWNVESGVYYAQNGQRTGSSPQLFGGRNEAFYDAAKGDRLYFNTAVSLQNSQMSMNSIAGVIEIDNMPKGAEIAASPEAASGYGNSFISQGEFAQVFDFLEVPLYLRYLLFGSGMNVELIGGINAGVIVGNSAFLENQFGMQHIGRTSDISTINISGTMGLGFSYNLGSRISLALEPRLNYYLNSINRNADIDYRPYRVGVYTGLYYAF